MTASAKNIAEAIANHLERGDARSVEHVRRNLKALIVNSLDLVERTPDVMSAAQSADHEVKLFLEQAEGFMGIPDRGPGAEGQRLRAIRASRRFEAALEAAPVSGKARALGIG